MKSRLALALTLLFSFNQRTLAVPADYSQFGDGQGFVLNLSGDADNIRVDIANTWTEGNDLDPSYFLFFPQGEMHFGGALHDARLGQHTFIFGIHFAFMDGNGDFSVSTTSSIFPGEPIPMSDDWAGQINGEDWIGTFDYTVTQAAAGGGSGSGNLILIRAVPDATPTIFLLAFGLFGMISGQKKFIARQIRQM